MMGKKFNLNFCFSPAQITLRSQTNHCEPFVTDVLLPNLFVTAGLSLLQPESEAVSFLCTQVDKAGTVCTPLIPATSSSPGVYSFREK